MPEMTHKKDRLEQRVWRELIKEKVGEYDGFNEYDAMGE